MMANTIPKWKKYRELRKRVNEHVAAVSSAISNIEHCQSDDDLTENMLAESSSSQNAEWQEAASETCRNHVTFTTVDIENHNSEISDISCSGEVNGSSEIDFNWQQLGGTAEEILSDRNLSSSESETDESDDLALRLATWVTKFGVSHSAVNELLHILSPFHVCLPKDARTLLKTVKVYDIDNLAGGSYYHFGILDNVRTLIESVESIQEISLQINIDGLPLFKSSNMQFWPILGRLVKPCLTSPFIIGLYLGKQKPSSVSEYTQKLIQELDHLIHNGITLSKDDTDYHIPFNLACIICDTPARAFVKCSKGHSGYFGCDKCSQRGLWRGKMTFPETDAPRRTDSSFDEMLNIEHHLGPSPFRNLPIGMVSQFPLDYMHLVCLGVMKRLIWLWMNGPRTNNCRVSAQTVQLISDSLINLKNHMPREFNRKGRPLFEVERWKATEFRQFLLYTGPVVLKNHLSSAAYNHFLLLFVGIFCLSCDFLFEAYRVYAGDLLRLFVQQFGQFYGQDMIVYNVHGLTHLAEDAGNFGLLDNYSSFPFESFLGGLKKLVRKPNLALQQAIRRISERHNARGHEPFKDCITVKKLHTHGPVPRQYQGYQQYKEIHFPDYYISVYQGDNCILVGDNVAVVRNILSDIEGTEKYIVYEKFNTTSNFFTYPLQSADLRVTKVSNLSGYLHVASAESVCKCVLIPLRNKFVAFPMLHRFKS